MISPAPFGGEPPCKVTSIITFIQWLLSDWTRAVLGLLYIVVLLTFALGITWVAAPQVGAIGAAVLGAGTTVGSGTVMEAARRRRSRKTSSPAE